MTSDPNTDLGLPAELLAIIRCPACLGEFLPPQPGALVCSSCGLSYPVRNGVPILLVDEAEQTGAASSTGSD
jgi:uncharacterized protein YbaR (Trm112 family)